MKTVLSLTIALAVVCAVRSETVPGLESYGDLTLVDSINCGTDNAHEFRDFPSGNSYVSNILGRACRVIHHVPKNSANKESGAYISWRIGADANLVPNAPYLLVVDYPDDAPRSATVMNYGAPSRRGFHTGATIGDAESPPYVMNFPESFNVAFSGAYQRIEQVMFPCEKPEKYDGSGNRISLADDGFDLSFALFPKDDAPGSLGVAVASIRLYRITDESFLKAEINYPDESLPRRVITWREEMSDDNGHAAYTDPLDFYRAKSKLMDALAINTYSKDLLEFGYCQHWDPTYHDYGGGWMNYDYGSRNIWGGVTEIMGAAGHWLLPYYEYAGGRGAWNSLGDKQLATPLKNGGLYSNASWVDECRVDITSAAAEEDFKKILDCTILRYKDNAKMLGSWIRNRGQMPISFHEDTVKLFCKETGRAEDSVTRQSIASAGESSDIYKEYRAWWYGKRAQFLEKMRQYLVDNGVEGAKSFYTSTIGETGEYANNWWGDTVVSDSTAWQQMLAATGQEQNDNGDTRLNRISVGSATWNYKALCLEGDWPTWGIYEQQHAAPHDDPENYTNSVDVALTYPFNRVYTVVGGDCDRWRDKNGDLFLVRFHSLNENAMYDADGRAMCGYYTADFEKAGPACMLSELWAMAISDPNMLGYLCGFNMARNYTLPARKFNQNFLSLPATKSEVVDGQGGYWGAALTVRKWTTPAGNYFAVINTSGNSYSSTNIVFALPSGGIVYETVSHAAHELDANGAISIDIGPYEMIAFSTVRPGASVWSASAIPSDRSATVSVKVSSYVDEGASTLSGRYSASSDFSNATVLESKSVSDVGDVAWDLSGLSPLTTYYVELTMTDPESRETKRTLTFKTLTPADWPSASELAIDSVGVTNLTAKATVDKLGEGATEATVIFELAKSEDMAGAIERSVVLTSAGEAALTFGALNSETEHYVRATVSNSLANVVTLDPVGATTKKVSTATPFTGKYAPGLMQAKYGCEKSKYPDFSVTLSSFSEADLDRTPGVVMSETGADYENSLSGTKWSWANNTTFAYFGEMWFEGGRTYNFFHCVDDGVAIKLDDEWLTRQSAENISGFNAGVTKVQKTYETSGWHAIRVFVYDWDGGKGYVDGKVGFKMGLGWNTNGCYEVKADTAAKWSALVDPGDGSLLRTRTSVPELISISGVSQAGRRIWTTVATELYDDDCELEISVSTSADTKTVVKTINPTDRTLASVNVNTDYDVAGTDPIYVAARLFNERTGYDYWTAPVKFLPQDDTPRCEFGEIEAAVDLGGTNATIRTTVVDVNGEDAKVELKVNGETVNTWNDVQPADVLEFKSDVARGSTNVYAFVFTSGEVEVTSDPGVFVATTYTDWFTVDFENDEAYVNGTDWANVPAARGSWTVSGESELKDKAYVTLGDSTASYRPTKPSEDNADAKVWGRTKVTDGGIKVDLSDMRPCVALTFIDLVPYVYVNGAWLALEGGTPLVAGAPVDYTVSFRFMETSVPPTVMFTVGDWTSPWVSAADMPRKLSSLDFGANGEFGSFHGAYYSLLPEGAVIELEMPEFTKDGSALKLEDAKFSMTISNPVKDAWYTVFIAEKLTDTFKAAEDSAQFSADTPTFTLTVDADKPSLFAKIVISSAPYKAGDEL